MSRSRPSSLSRTSSALRSSSAIAVIRSFAALNSASSRSIFTSRSATDHSAPRPVYAPPDSQIPFGGWPILKGGDTKLPPQDTASRNQRRPEERQGSHHEVGRTARVGHLLAYDRARQDALGVAEITRRCLRRVLIVHRRRANRALTAPVAGWKLLARDAVGIRVEPVWVAPVLFPLRLGFFLGGEVCAVQVSPATSSAAIAIGEGLARLSVIVPIEVARVARVALKLRLGRCLRAEARAVELIILGQC